VSVSDLSRHTIIFFDGHCNLCNKSVQFLLRHDRREVLLFSPLQGNTSKKVLSTAAQNSDTVVLWHNGREWLRSSAVIRTLMLLGFPWNLTAIFLPLPAPLRNLLYRFVARYRLKWFGRSDTCWIMQEKWKSRFV
jgi:predicted DCC family thiol-disulfide oxidoreductase YuxK